MAEPWYLALWAMADHTMRRWAHSAKRLLGLLRLVRFLLVVGVVAILLSAALGLMVAAGWIGAKWFYVAYAVAALFLVVPLAALAVLVALPLRARSLVRLVDMGYPANARELLIRVVARKLHDESIQTEELLVDTALNEARKMMRKARRAEPEAGERVDMPPPTSAAPAPIQSSGPPPPPPL